ncbi:zinc ribbon domain-containing protein [Thermococcus sp. MV11]|uniref:zinc ribbon domain-containing protein n=1 Tax=Thermococcus sp. MV11 TaxID=1638267 RepID=UPI00143138D1|nr:zinc ribbon domain-containing protein [Thermococcus sp. MV11]NJE03372.1 zinc ribbon domain-containing protein [Thermococcus sp. MV11]
MEPQGFRCERCGAPLEVSPETIVAVCPYCGFPNHISGNLKTENIHIVPTMDKNAIAKAFWKRVERDFDLKRMKEQIEIVDIEGHYAPYWVGDVHVEGDVEYMVREEECHTDSEGETHCHTVERHYHDHVDETLGLIGSARRQVRSFGVDDIIAHYSRHRPKGKKLLELDEGEWGRIKLEVLNTEMDEVQAKMMMREDAIDVIRNRYSAKADRIERFDVTADEPRNVSLLLLPMWTVYYKHENSIYHAVFAGWDGKDVAATEPMPIWRRAQYMAGVVLGVLIGAAGAAYGGANGSAMVSLLSLIIGAGTGGYFGSLVLEGQRTERSTGFMGNFMGGLKR